MAEGFRSGATPFLLGLAGVSSATNAVGFRGPFPFAFGLAGVEATTTSPPIEDTPTSVPYASYPPFQEKELEHHTLYARGRAREAGSDSAAAEGFIAKSPGQLQREARARKLRVIILAS